MIFILYFNIFLIFSIFGFILESVVFKYSKVNKHSSIFYGPYTFVYGAGGLIIYGLTKLFANSNIWLVLEVILVYLLTTILLTSIEFLDGKLIKRVFGIDMWDYSEHKYCYKKYICLDLAIIWGTLGTLFYFFGFNFVNGMIDLISVNASIIILIIVIFDIGITLYKKAYRRS